MTVRMCAKITAIVSLLLGMLTQLVHAIPAQELAPAPIPSVELEPYEAPVPAEQVVVYIGVYAFSAP